MTSTGDPGGGTDASAPGSFADPAGDGEGATAGSNAKRAGASFGRALREIVIIVVIALVASALLRAFVVQAFFVPSGSMLPTIQLHDRIVVSRIGDVERGEVVVFEDPGGWIPASEQPAPAGPLRSALEWVGLLPNSGREHLVKRVIGLPGDHVVCCNRQGRLVINGYAVNETGFLADTSQGADNQSFNVTVPANSIFVLGDNRYVSGDSSRHPEGQSAFVPMNLVTGRAVAVVWPASDIKILHIPSAYDGVPAGGTPPRKGTFSQGLPGNR